MLAQQVFTAYDRSTTRGPRYRYCPSCGTTLTRNTSDSTRMQCSGCGWMEYQNPAPGVVIVITDGDRVLLGRRRPQRSVAPGKWCLPGGFIEFHEDFLTAGIREAREETGLEVEIRSILSVSSNFLAADLHTLVVVLHASVIGGDPVAGDDIEALQWVPLQGPLPEMAFDADCHIIERYCRTRIDGAPVDPRYAREQLGTLTASGCAPTPRA